MILPRVSCGNSAQPPGDVTVLKDRIKEVANVLHASSIWKTPMGVDAHLSGGVMAPIVPKAQQYQPLAGYILMGSFEHFEIVQGTEPYEHAVAGETLLMQIVFNVVPKFSGGILLKDELGEFAAEPMRAADVLGFPAYGGTLVIITLTQFRDSEQAWRKGKPADGSFRGGLGLWTTWEAFRTADWKTIVGVIGK